MRKIMPETQLNPLDGYILCSGLKNLIFTPSLGQGIIDFHTVEAKYTWSTKVIHDGARIFCSFN
uniref:Uncharacterized protein n=1 Tax=Romanomermis culicivorax TaxID=13658 RepID=A0A915L9Z6_ROMCU